MSRHERDVGNMWKPLRANRCCLNLDRWGAGNVHASLARTAASLGQTGFRWASRPRSRARSHPTEAFMPMSERGRSALLGADIGLAREFRPACRFRALHRRKFTRRVADGLRTERGDLLLDVD